MSETRIGVYTAIFGDRDRLRDPRVVSAESDYICFTDRRQPSDVWNVRVVDSPFHDPRRTSRQYKVLSHLYLPEYLVSIYVDGNITPRVPVRSLLRFLDNADLAAFKHRCRRCLYDEAAECRRLGLDHERLIAAQIAHYAGAGYPEQNGMNEAGVLIRRHTDAIRRFNNAWWAEICRHSTRDQISFNYVAWSQALRIATLPDHVHASELFDLCSHSESDE